MVGVITVECKFKSFFIHLDGTGVVNGIVNKLLELGKPLGIVVAQIFVDHTWWGVRRR